MTDHTQTAQETEHEHLLPQRLLCQQIQISLVGCGGTGSTMAVGLVYLHQALLAFGHPGGLHVTLVDGDRISAVNCVRQPFSESEIGLYKADVLASRINLFWGLQWDSDTRFIGPEWRPTKSPDIIISCVDTRRARRLITQTNAYRKALYWLDIGNNADTGQFIFGQPSKSEAEHGTEVHLPNAADLFPEIIDESLDAKDKLPSCSALEALESQSPFVNQVLAYQALAMLARFFRHGRLTVHGAFANLSSVRVCPLPIDPAVWARIVNTNAASQGKPKRLRRKPA
ncbi:MAG TPA: PRTRC system ThiF family protein [Candidatus Angelobacter sp.]|nr:PRTRC system ThiF family protein [Candidatus Angelobacter sp.]